MISVVNQRHGRGSGLSTTSRWEYNCTSCGGLTVVVQTIRFSVVIESHRRFGGRANHQIAKLHAFDERTAARCPERTCHRTAIARTNTQFKDAGLDELFGESVDVIHSSITFSICLRIIQLGGHGLKDTGLVFQREVLSMRDVFNHAVKSGWEFGGESTVAEELVNQRMIKRHRESHNTRMNDEK